MGADLDGGGGGVDLKEGGATLKDGGDFTPGDWGVLGAGAVLGAFGADLF